MKLFIAIFSCFIIITTYGQKCRSDMSITNSQCFNEIIYFEHTNKYYRAGHFAMNSKGDLIIEYSYLRCRLFFGFKKSGKFYFPEIFK